MKTAGTIAATVAICTYNGAARLPLVLEAVARQSRPRTDWEVLVIDNASTDSTNRIADHFIRERLGGCARVVREEQLGLSFARARVAREAQGEIICFLDDDNIPEPDFVGNAIRAFCEHPRAGLMGGRVKPQWECNPTPLALAVSNYALAICDRGSASFRYEGISSGPVGAGMCVRGRLLRELYSDAAFPRIIGRRGAKLAAGEDAALFVRTHQAGWEVWYEPSLSVAHTIPKRRMQKDYLLRLYDGFGRCDVHIRALYDRKARITVLRIAIGLKDFGRWIVGRLIGPSKELRRQHPDVADDLHDLGQRMTRARALEAIWPQQA